MTLPQQENSNIAVLEEVKPVEEQPWYVNDNFFTSYMSASNDYMTEWPAAKVMPWFNFDIRMPDKTEREIQQEHVVINQQQQLGILDARSAAYLHNQLELKLQSMKPPVEASTNGSQLDPQIMQAMEVRITPPFITMRNGQEVSEQVSEQQKAVETTPVQQPSSENRRKESIIADILGSGTKDNKYSFALPGKNKVGKNDPCPCGSFRKYKLCHGR